MRDLSRFLSQLEQDGELHRVSAPVSPLLEVTEIVQRHCRMAARVPSSHAAAFDPDHHDRGGAALLFENVEGSDFPLAVNLFGSYRRTELALGCTGGGFEAIAARIGSLTKPEPPSSLRAALAKAREVAPLLRIPPKTVRSGACQEVVRLASNDDVDLTRLPIIKCWPLDGDPTAVGYDTTPQQAGTAAGQGRYITLAGIHTIHADDEGAAKPSSHNIGMYRCQLIDRTRLAMHWHMHHDGASHWRSWKRAGKPMPIAICLGGDAVLPYAATAPLPPGISELLMAGFLSGRGIQLVPAKTVPLRVPASSEIVIEGYVSTECGPIGYDPRPDESGDRAPLGPGAVFEGPFGDHTGFYSLPDRYPIVEVTAITHRRGAVYPTTIVGLPPQEDYYLGKATERLFLPLLKTLIHDIDDYHLPLFGCFHNCAFVRIHKAYPLQARRVMHSIWGAGQMAWTKLIVVVDDDVDVHDETAVLRTIFERCHFGRDLERVNGPLDILDHAAPRLGAGHKLGFDATRRVAGEEVNGVAVDVTPRRVDVGEEHEAALRERVGGAASIVGVHLPAFGHGRLAIVAVDKRNAGAGGAAIEATWRHAGDLPLDMVIAVDAEHDPRDVDRALFLLCANSDPGRDIHGDGGRLGVDATAKVPGDERHGQPARDFPPILEMDAEIVERVDRRWDEYGF